jgi:murein DD-endopeptidase MepM/ murein hydrolase activator NlpD
MISAGFDAEKGHYGLDIVSNPNESVLAVLDGTVLMATYTADSGYIIAVLHGQDMVSVYKHCGVLLKKQGDTVKAGEDIALVGKSGEKASGNHLHFELWSRGHALDPSKYIVF